MITFDRPPSLGRSLLRAAVSWKGAPPAAADLPRLEAVLRGHRPSEASLADWRAVCAQTASMPIVWPQLVATTLHLALLTAREFPVRAMGLVHPRVRLVQHAPFDPLAPMDLDVGIGAPRDVPNGLEFDLQARVHVDGKLVWESTAATFARARTSKSAKDPAPVEAAPTWDRRVPIELPADAGRRYARVSGDWNPVHLHPLGARLFGYQRPIGHGWWLLPRTLGALGLDGPRVPAVVEARFLRPSLLPSRLEAVARDTDDGVQFALLDPRDGKVKLEGSVR